MIFDMVQTPHIFKPGAPVNYVLYRGATEGEALVIFESAKRWLQEMPRVIKGGDPFFEVRLIDVAIDPMDPHIVIGTGVVI